MRPSHHAAFSFAVSASFFALTRSWGPTLICFLSGILIDLDHHLDYWIVRKRVPWKYRDLVDYCDSSDEKWVYLIFHSYEALFLLWATISFFELGPSWIGFASGVTVHIILDDIVNPMKPISYFILYRWRHGFERKNIFIRP